MRIDGSRLIRPPITSPTGTGAGGVRDAPPAARPATAGIASGAVDLIDRVKALVDRLAVQAGARPAAVAAPDADVAAMLGGIFGKGAASDVQLEFDYRHGAAAFASASSGDAGWSRDLAGVDATGFSARGTFTGEDGHHYAFTIDYAAVYALSAHASHGDAVAPPASADPFPVASVAGALPTLEWSQSLLERIRRLLGLPDAGDSARQAAADAAPAA